MDHFHYRSGQLCAEDVPLTEIAAQHGTPCYVYSRATIERHWHAFDAALADVDHLVCYAVKANSNLGVLSVMARLGSGFDIVSVVDLSIVLRAGGDPNKIVFSGVGKRADELRRALEVGIHCFNVESAAELERLNEVAAEMGTRAPVSLRVNPDVDAKTHPYISTGLKENKFGIDIAAAPALYARAAQMAHIEIIGVDCHIGSQLTQGRPFVAALQRVLALVDELAARGVYLKPTAHKNFAVVDAAMNELIRPALYDAWQQIVPVVPRCGDITPYDVVGPVCETGDFLGKDRPLCIEAGELLAIRSAGAYGFSMSSQYNSRPRAAELMVDGDQVHVVRRREDVDDLLRGEAVLPP